MIFISICIGSSCFLKGSQELVELFKKRIETDKLSDEIVLTGSFCLGRCNREGVTVSVDDGEKSEIFVGITPAGFNEFWNSQIEPRLERGKK